MVRYTTGAMRIGLIADTHIPEARDELWPQVFDAFRNVDAILHGGDIYNVDLLDELATLAPLWACRGNGDDGSGGRPVQPDHPLLQPGWLLDFEGVRVALVHRLPLPEYPPVLTVGNTLERHFGHREVDVVIHGDTHVESIEDIGGVLCVNPGSPTFPHNLDTQHGTLGYLDIEAGKVEASIWQIAEHGIEPFDWTRWRERRPMTAPQPNGILRSW